MGWEPMVWRQRERDRRNHGGNVMGEKQEVGRLVMAIGCVVAGVGVAAGAFGAHMLKTMLEPPMLATYDTGTRYQMYHAFGMILSGMGAGLFKDDRLATAGWFFAAGLLMFCGSLYGMALFDWRWLGPITPIGGLAFMAGWLLLGWRVWRAMGSAGR